ncbi:AMIN domain-containing protein [Arsenophonus endosymbiont of Aphis craccivora]|uniref:N-acetylmuramoyl-L-alanine amidase n=1 Tax=Arsenophonus endosymbiont of Aphis craccivora TaxID=1231049 RepID=UPI0015DBDEDF|nr:N-acetylmuramoyl-L-alanine amidase [Arsenophonus endosymbiont of Aphis craccivora]QLK87900.1 AMIN domain-containing protein [Arsenophonus endosymbiont of Aphis craccivora]
MMKTSMINIIKRWQTHVFLLLITIILLSNLLLSNAQSATLSNIRVNDNLSEAKVTLHFAGGNPEYRFFPLHEPERLVVDFRQSDQVSGLPMKFINNNLVKGIRTSQPPNSQYQRIVIELANAVKASAVAEQINHRYQIVLTLKNNRAEALQPQTSQSATEATNKLLSIDSQAEKKLANNSPTPSIYKNLPKGTRQVVVAIDAGHGGKDPGAIVQNGHREKNITMIISCKLESHLKTDPMFKPVMTRNGDYFISVAGRSEVARKKAADMLVSIHADAAPNNRARGASVWVLSNRRANSELGNWLEQHEKQFELLGGAGDALANGADPYLSQAVLDLQFGNSQRVGYAVALKVLRELSKIGNIHKYDPEHASLGVLRSPDIPSILVETGFISNISEERLLVSDDYQESLAVAIHQGLRNYFTQHPLQAAPK